MLVRNLILSLLVLAAMPATAADLLAPDPGLSPERVVEIQLQSLQRNDVPTPDAGIAQTWAFAHPDNRRVTGPLERFAAMIKGPYYRLLLGHREHAIRTVVQTEDRAVFAVTVVTPDGQRAAYEWELSKVRSGPFAGSWMTVSVSPPPQPRNAI